MIGITTLSKSFVKGVTRLVKSYHYSLLFLICLFLSFLFHLLLFKKAKDFKLSLFNSATFDTIIPRHVQLKRVKIDQSLVTEDPKFKNQPVPIAIPIDESKISLEGESEVKVTKPGTIKIEDLEEEKLDSFKTEEFFSTEEVKSKVPFLELEQISNKNDNSLKEIEITSKNADFLENYSKIEELLEQNKPLTSKTAPIFLPTDILFEYNLDQLKPKAEKSLEILAVLIQRNPKAEFTIEGFTDNFGSEEYNLDLSQRRADSIKKWLLIHSSIDSSKIQTKGCGKTHFIAPSTGSIEEQRLNRRVEIVIH